MNGKIPIFSVFSAIIFTLFLGWPREIEAFWLKQGKITGLEMSSRTVVVEVPLGSQLYTVGGELSTETTLKKDGMKANLNDFRVGDVVRVGWKKTEGMHKIESLELIASASDLPAKKIDSHSRVNKLIGTPQRHIIMKKETLLDIARQYGLGFNEIQDLYPHLDPWIPPEGMELTIPSQWILPEGGIDSIVINVAELRLYYFTKEHGIVKTFPIGIGDIEWPTPFGKFKVGDKRVRPTWYIPPSLREKYGVKSIPPGPENPLGDYWIGLGGTMYGIHGTDIPWSVGRLVTHGCIRMYPEDIRQFFYMIKPGTLVKIIYEPVKIGFLFENIYVEAHRDIYEKIGDIAEYGHGLLREMGIVERVDLEKYQQALESQNGMPMDITRRTPSLNDAHAEAEE